MDEILILVVGLLEEPSTGHQKRDESVKYRAINLTDNPIELEFKSRHTMSASHNPVSDASRVAAIVLRLWIKLLSDPAVTQDT
eukprot:2681439-Amphidinium_carterae.1